MGGRVRGVRRGMRRGGMVGCWEASRRVKGQKWSVSLTPK